MTVKHLHFSEAELAGRREKVCTDLAAHNLDALLMFRQESMYYLTGYDTFGYVFFQCLILTPDGKTHLLTRSPDKRQAEFTSTIDQISIWTDGADANPQADLLTILKDMGIAGQIVGVEWDTHGLTAGQGQKLASALNSEMIDQVDATYLVSRHRLIKSPAEIEYVRKAAELSDAAYASALKIAGPGADEAAILAAMHNTIYLGGGDDPANEFIIGSGPGALMCRYYSGRRILDADDQLTLEWSAAYRHYHAAMMRTVSIGPAPQRQQDMMKAATDALLACEEALKPGNTMGEVFQAHATTIDAAGMAEHRMNACGYSMGTTYAPNWMDWPMFYANNPVELAPGMTFFLHMIIFDSDTGLAASMGRSSLITAAGSKPLSATSLEFVII